MTKMTPSFAKWRPTYAPPGRPRPPSTLPHRCRRLYTLLILMSSDSASSLIMLEVAVASRLFSREPCLWPALRLTQAGGLLVASAEASPGQAAKLLAFWGFPPPPHRRRPTRQRGVAAAGSGVASSGWRASIGRAERTAVQAPSSVPVPGR